MKKLKCRQLLTVEPVIFFYAYGLFMHLPVIQQYVYFRISKSKGFPYSTKQSNSCGNETALNETMKELEKQVQSLSSYVHLGIVMFASVPSLFTSLLIGSWSDSRGRKPSLFLPALGSVLEAAITLLVIHFEWPVYVLFIGGAINGLCGYFTTIICGIMAYIADTTDEADRPVRLAVLELMTFLGGMVSQLTSGIWIEKFGFEVPYWFILACLLFAALYTVFFVPESRPRTDGPENAKFGSCKSLKRIYTVYATPREGGRLNLFLLSIGSGLMQLTMQGVSGVIILFILHSPLCFSPEYVGYFSALRSLSIGVGAIVGIKLFSRCVSELTISRVGIITRIGSLVLLGFSSTTLMVFLSPIVGLFNGCVGPIFRGMMSRIVSENEQGALFAAVASFETLFNFIGAAIFNSLYPVSLKFHFPGFVFIIGAVLTLIPFFMLCCLNNPMSLLSKRDRVQIVGNYDKMPDDNLNEPVANNDSLPSTEATSFTSTNTINNYNTDPSV